MKTKLNIFAVVLIFLVLYVFLLGVRPLIMPDEVRYVEIPREMLADGDFVTPRLNGLRYFEKPIMGYWLIAGSLRVFGENSFAARFVPAVSTGLAALIVLLLAGKMTGRKELGAYAAGCFLLMPLVFIIGTFCTLDAVFSLFITATVASFYCAMEGYLERNRVKCLSWLAATGAAAGCAFLVKGFLAFALPVMAMLPWLIWEKRWKAIFTLPWLPFAVALIVIAPWAILVYRAQPDFWRYFVIEEHFSRFFGGAEAEHPHGPHFFVVTLLWGAAEWFLLLPAIAVGIRKTGIRGEKLSWFRFLFCWFAGPFILLSASSGKLPTYILPCFPPLAIMITVGLFRYFEEHSDGKGKLFDVPLMVFSGAALIAGPVALVVLGYVLPNHFDFSIYGKAESWKFIVMVCTFVLVLAGAVAAFVSKDPSRKLLFFLATAFPIFVASFFLVPQSVYDARCISGFLEECRDEITPDTLIIAHGSNVHAVCYAYHRNDLVMNVPGELDYGLTYPEAADREVKGCNVRKFVADYPDKNKKIVMFFPANRYYDHKSKNLLPPPIFEKKSIPSDPESREADGLVFARFQ